MIELLLAIQQQLRNELTYVRASDIFITPHIGFIPQGTMRPCIGIKDGKIKHTYGAGHSKQFEMPVRLSIFVDLSNKEESIIGNPVHGIRGILDIREDCILALDGNKLGIQGMCRAKIADDPASELFRIKQGLEVQRKQLGITYEKQIIVQG